MERSEIHHFVRRQKLGFSLLLCIILVELVSASSFNEMKVNCFSIYLLWFADQAVEDDVTHNTLINSMIQTTLSIQKHSDFYCVDFRGHPEVVYKTSTGLCWQGACKGGLR